MLRILKGEDNLSIIKNTCIVLIPKVANQEELGQFRHIRMCSVVYKIASTTTKIFLEAGLLD